MIGPLLTAWRRTGADLPFGDPAAARGTPFEGWYWRLSDPRSGRVIVVLCGAMRGWSLGAVAAHPGGFLRERIAPTPGELVDGHLRARIAADATVDVDIGRVHDWPRRPFGALGIAHLLPFLPQYWQPVVLRGRAHGEARIGGERVAIDGWDAYHEKNWGPAFAGEWWWGQAHLGEVADVAFAGGAIGGLAPTAVVVRAGRRVLAIAPPSMVRARTGDGTWAIRARSARHRVTIEGQGGSPVILPVPAQDGVEHRSHQVLAGRLHLRVEHRGRVLVDAESGLAALERGLSSRTERAAPPA